MTNPYILRLSDEALRELRDAVLEECTTRWPWKPPRKPNSIVGRIAALAVGESLLLEGRTGHFTGSTKKYIRHRESNPDFDYMCRLTTKGLRITRTV